MTPLHQCALNLFKAGSPGLNYLKEIDPSGLSEGGLVLTIFLVVAKGVGENLGCSRLSPFEVQLRLVLSSINCLKITVTS